MEKHPHMGFIHVFGFSVVLRILYDKEFIPTTNSKIHIKLELQNERLHFPVRKTQQSSKVSQYKG